VGHLDLVASRLKKNMIAEIYEIYQHVHCKSPVLPKNIHLKKDQWIAY
jgi:hypothetical protein